MGSIINIGSMTGMVGMENANCDGATIQGWYPDYFLQKGGAINLTRFRASYFGRFKLRVYCISAGGLQTSGHLEPLSCWPVVRHGRQPSRGRRPHRKVSEPRDRRR